VTFDTSFGLGMMIDVLRENALGYATFEVVLARLGHRFSLRRRQHTWPEATFPTFRFIHTDASGQWPTWILAGSALDVIGLKGARVSVHLVAVG